MDVPPGVDGCALPPNDTLRLDVFRGQHEDASSVGSSHAFLPRDFPLMASYSPLMSERASLSPRRC